MPFVVKVLNEPLFMHSSLDNAAIARSASELQEVSVQIRKRVGKDFELDLALALPPGITILFGPSGAGKTTLLDCIAGLVRPDAGRIATQEKVLFGHTVVLGTAGSGKTLMAILRARYLASTTTEHSGRTLLVTFNKTLVAYLAMRPAGLRGVTIETFHRFATGYLASRRTLGSNGVLQYPETLVGRAVKAAARVSGPPF